MKLSASEKEKIERCVIAAVDGSFFSRQEGLLQTLTGFDREQALQILYEREGAKRADYELLVNNVLNSLIGYPHRKPDELYARTGMNREEIRSLFAKFREQTGRNTAKNHFEGME